MVGGDQGLLNTFFPAYHRLSFTYNVTPSTNYQYTPAYRHFSSNISLFHFIGRTKPWNTRSYGTDSFNEATGRWWSIYEKHFGWKLREEELQRGQEAALRKGQSYVPQEQQPHHHQEPPSSQPIYHPPDHGSRPSTADRAKKQVSFGSTDTAFFHPSAPPPQLSSTYQAPPMQREYEPPPAPAPAPAPPPPQPPHPFEPSMVTWDPARSAPPPDSGPEARDLTISTYESAWDKPFNPHEPRWVPPPPAPLPRGYEYTPPPPAPPVPAAESHDPSSDEEDEPVEQSEYHTSDSESPEGGPGGGGEKQKERFGAVFPWEMRGQRQAATRVFPGDQPSKGKAPEEVPPSERRPSLEKYEFSNA
jgi:glycogenin